MNVVSILDSTGMMFGLSKQWLILTFKYLLVAYLLY